MFYRCSYLPKVYFLGQCFQKLEPEQDRHAHREVRPNALIFTTLHSRVVNIGLLQVPISKAYQLCSDVLFAGRV